MEQEFQPIEAMETLEALYGDPPASSLQKVVNHVTPLYRRWLDTSRFVILSTVGPEGTDASPRGDVGPVVRIADPNTLLLPDWSGNNRIDSLRNILRDGRVSLMFLIPGCNNVVRVNGTAIVTAQPGLLKSFEQNGKHPRTVVAVTVGEVYFQCAKALLRSALWSGEDLSGQVPTAGEFVAARDESVDAASYDDAYPDRAKRSMW